MTDTKFRRGLTLAALGLIVALTTPVAAGDVWPWAPRSRVNDRKLPYFAEHPPVWYSLPVPRPYGFSPWATPPGLAPVEFEYLPLNTELAPLGLNIAPAPPAKVIEPTDRVAGPALILNPYVTAPARRDAPRGGPELILNPYVLPAKAKSSDPAY